MARPPKNPKNVPVSNDLDAPLPPVRRIGERIVTKEIQQQIEEGAANGMTNALIADTLGLAEGTVSVYRAAYEKRKREERELAERVFKPQRTPERLKEIMLKIPGVGETKAAFAEDAARSNPLLLQQPIELQSFLNDLLQMGQGYVTFVVKTFFVDILQQNPQASMQLGLQFAQPQIANGVQQGGNIQAMQTPSGIVYLPAPPQSPTGTVTREELQRILDERQEAQFVEEQVPILKQDGSPALGPDGQPLYKHIRRPVGQSQQPSEMERMMMFVTLMSKMRELNPAPAPPPQSSMDPQMQSMVMQLHAQSARLDAELQAQKALRETQDHFNKMLWESAQAQADLRSKMAVAQAGLSANDQVALKTVDAGAQALGRAMENMDKRLNRIEGFAAPILRNMTQQGPLVEIPPVAADLEAMAARANQNGQPFHPNQTVP